MRIFVMVTYMFVPAGGFFNISNINWTAPGNSTDSSDTVPYVSDDLYFSTAELIAEGLVLTAICILAIVGNTCMWIIVIRNKDLRTVTNSFLLTLAAADLMVSVINMPVTILTIFRGEWIFSDDACRALGFTNMWTLVTSVLSLCNISINRYIMVCKPTKFKDVYTRKNATIMIAVSTSTAFVLSLPPIFGWTEYSYAPIQSICFSDWAKAPSYAIFMITCCFGCPLIVMLICNLLILREVRRRNRRVMNRRKIHFRTVVNVITGGHSLNSKLCSTTFTHIGDSSTTSDTATICSENEAMDKTSVKSMQTEDVLTNQNPTKTFEIKIASTSAVNINVNHCQNEDETYKKGKVSCNKQPIVSASRSEIHLARMLCVVVVVFALCWSPYCVSMLFTVYWPEIFLPRSFHMTTLLIGYFNSSCNPVLYGVLNKRFGKEFRRIFDLCRRCCLKCKN